MGRLIRLNPDVAYACRELGLQVKLDGSKRVYWDIRWRREVELMWFRLNGNRTRFYVFRTIAVVSSVLIPALVALNLDGQAGIMVRWMTFTLSVLAGIATAVSGLFKASERWAINRRYLSPLYGEGVRFATLSTGYEGFETHSAAFDKFSLAVEKILDQFAAEFDRDFLLVSIQGKSKKKDVDVLQG
jgi:hypothetical protein